MWRCTLSILGWPWKKILKVIIVVAEWILEKFPDTPAPTKKP